MLPGVSGMYFMYSTGAADANGSARMLVKSVAGWVSVKTMVLASGVWMPETLVMPASIVAARAGRALGRVLSFERGAEVLEARDCRDVVPGVAVRRESRIAVAQDAPREILRGDRARWRRCST